MRLAKGSERGRKKLPVDRTPHHTNVDEIITLMAQLSYMGMLGEKGPEYLQSVREVLTDARDFIEMRNELWAVMANAENLVATHCTAAQIEDMDTRETDWRAPRGRPGAHGGDPYRDQWADTE